MRVKQENLRRAGARAAGRIAPALILWTLALFVIVCETLPVIMRDCASMTWGS